MLYYKSRQNDYAFNHPDIQKGEELNRRGYSRHPSLQQIPKYIKIHTKNFEFNLNLILENKNIQINKIIINDQ